MLEHETAEMWFYALTDDERSAVRSASGVVPRWLSDSLHRAGIATVCAEGADGRRLHLLPLEILDFLARPDTAVRNMTWQSAEQAVTVASPARAQ